MLAAVQAYLRAAAGSGRTVEMAGPFAVLLHPGTAMPHASYAIPHAGAEPTAADVALLLAAFRRAHRTPRLEYLPALAPAVEEAVTDHGFAVEGRLDLMACRPADARPVPAGEGVTLHDVDPAADPAAAEDLVRVQHEAFGERPTPSEVGASVARMSTPAVLARVDGQPAGGGACLEIRGGTTEVVGIGTLPAFRGRGVAAAVTARLVQRAFAAGAEIAVLTPGDEATGRIYARCGFSVRGEMLHLRAA
ncbi:GNAT family N-acetyltransferase [Patulibacter americanus]|uniref:GNAT family N-acetyltransferase n=1 Tax=Patulibacter americanus TaxID=588672 RepID=UPI0003B5F744|nr:GNAT family N-acetyltransferase [Patulibacter americanus]